MIVSFLERLCTASGHRIGPLCSYVVRQDSWWHSRNSGRSEASLAHCEKRERFESGMLDLPFPSASAAGPAAEPVSGEQPPSAETAASLEAHRKRQAKSA